MISFDQTSYSYGAVEVISAATLDMPTGSMHFLTGPSGAGKTTFLKLCYFALFPTTGSVSVLGHQANNIDRDLISSIRRRIGVVHQDCQFLDHLSIHENVALPLVVTGQKADQKDKEIDDLLAWVELDHRRNARPNELSGGEKQRLALARAVILSPDVIIADEPTGNIDWEMGQRLMALLVELNRLGKTILVATHDLNLIRATASRSAARILRLKGGRVTLAGSQL